MGCPESALRGKMHQPALESGREAVTVSWWQCRDVGGARCPLEARGQDGVTRASSGHLAHVEAPSGGGAAGAWPLPTDRLTPAFFLVFLPLLTVTVGGTPWPRAGGTGTSRKVEPGG